MPNKNKKKNIKDTIVSASNPSQTPAPSSTKDRSAQPTKDKSPQSTSKTAHANAQTAPSKQNEKNKSNRPEKPNATRTEAEPKQQNKKENAKAAPKTQQESKSSNKTAQNSAAGQPKPEKPKKPSKKKNNSSKSQRTAPKVPVTTCVQESVAFGRLSNVRVTGSLCNFVEIDRIARVDAKSLATDPEAYIKANRWQYYYGINTWFYLMQDLIPDEALVKIDYLAQFILSQGLVRAVNLCCELALSLVREEEPGLHPMACLVEGMCLRDKLQVLRFLKRFTPLKAAQLDTAAVDGWVEVEDNTRDWHRHNELPGDWRTYCTHRIAEYLHRWNAGYARVTPNKVWARGVKIPTGANLGPGYKDMRKRVALFACRLRKPYGDLSLPMPSCIQEVGEARPVAGPVMIGGERADKEVFNSIEANASLAQYPDDRGRTIHFRANRLVPVPKSLKGPRLVCPEAVVNQIMQRAIRDGMYDAAPAWVRKHIPVKDQTVMERVAYNAFAFKLTTTDLSHASDSLATGAVASVFPAPLAQDLLNWRPTYTYLPGRNRPRRLEQFSTMGTGNVWYVMAEFLLACMLVACDLDGVPEDRKECCFVFGDDMIHPDEITETLYNILETFGFVVNRDKSYGSSSRYRESCGAEWFLADDGTTVLDIRTIYYPRFPVACEDNGVLKRTVNRSYDPLKSETVVTDTLTRFVAMQHAFFERRFHNANRFLVEAIRAMHPAMTMTAVTVANPLSSISDLAGHYDLPAVVKRPYRAKPKHATASSTPALPTYVDPETQRMYPANERPGHACPVVSYSDAPRAAIIEEWLYYEYLIFGPRRHSDPVLAAMGMTEQRTVRTGEPSIDWKVR